MGYRSIACLVVTKEGYRQLIEDMDRLYPPDKPEFEQARTKSRHFLTEGCNEHRTAEDGSQIFYWEDVKWYHSAEEYPEIYFIEEFMRYRPDNSDKRLQEFRFLCIGENYDDTDDIGGYIDDPFSARLVRSIEFDT